MNLLHVSNLFSGSLLLTVAIFFLVKRRFKPYGRPFLLFIIVNLAGIIGIGFETGETATLWTVGYYLLYFHVAFLPYAWYLLGSRWGVDRSEHSRTRVVASRVFLVLAAGLMVYLWAEQGVDITVSDNRWFLDYTGRQIGPVAFLVICLTAGAYTIENCYRSSLGLSRERIKRSFFPLLAYAIGLLSMSTVALLYGKVGDVMMTLTFLLAALVSVPAARHYILFEPDGDGIILTRKGVYSSIVVVLFGVYYLLIGAVGEVLVKYRLDEGLFFSTVVLILLVITFMILVVSQMLRSRFRAVSPAAQPIPAKGVFGAEWKEFLEEMSAPKDLDAIYNRTNRLLHRLLKIEPGIFVVKEPPPSENYTLYSGDGIDRGLPGEQLDGLSDWLYRYGHAIEAATFREKAGKLAEQLDALEEKLPIKLFLLVPLIARQQNIGFWGVGRHGSGRNLSSYEIGFVEAVSGSPVAQTILNARMTDELVISREMESFHRFSSFVLHDLKNSVAMLSMLLQNAEKNISNPEFQKEALETISKAVNRQKKIISRLTEERTDSKLSLEGTDLADLIQKTLERVRLKTATSIDLTFEVEAGITIIVDPDKIGSVFDNLVLNAVEAMPEGGRLEIRSLPADGPGYRVVSFKDSGVGMNPEFIGTRLFKPFSSTKAYGLGIGMYQAREIIKAHKGRLEVISEPGRGTEIIVYLPGE